MFKWFLLLKKTFEVEPPFFTICNFQNHFVLFLFSPFNIMLNFWEAEFKTSILLPSNIKEATKAFIYGEGIWIIPWEAICQIDVALNNLEYYIFLLQACKKRTPLFSFVWYANNFDYQACENKFHWKPANCKYFKAITKYIW